MGHCRTCYSKNLHPVHRLAALPIAHQFGKTEEEALSRDTYEMQLEVCGDCGVAQFKDVIPPEILYSDYNFCFSTWKAQPHIEDEIAIINQLMPDGTLLEVGCNDGLFLENFKCSGNYQCIGVEPNSVSAKNAESKGIRVINSFFEDAVASELQSQSVDIVIARQVLEHIVDIKKFFQLSRNLLSDNGLMCIEVPNTQIAIDTGDVSCLWEEHISYFTPDSLKTVFAMNDFEVCEERRYLFSGEALFVVGRKRPEGSLSQTVQQQPEATNSYMLFRQRLGDYTLQLKSVIAQARDKGIKVAVYGSGCRSSVLLNGLEIQNHIDVIVDDQAEKQNLYMAKVPAQIKAFDDLNKDQSYLFLLSVNKENEEKVSAKIKSSDIDMAAIASLHSPNNILTQLEACRDAIAQI